MNHSAAALSTGEVVRAALKDAHPPLFDVLLHGWMCLFPDSEFAARYLSVIFSMTGITLTAFYAWRLTGNRLSVLIATGLLSLSYFHITYAIEARYYSLLYLLALGFTAHTLLYLKNARSSDLLLLVAFGIPLAYCHVFGAILIASTALGMPVACVLKRLPVQMLLRYWLACLVTGLSLLPVIRYLLAGTSMNSWMAKPSPLAFFEYLYEYTGKNPLEFLFFLLPFVMAWIRPKCSIKLLMASTVLLCFLLPLLLSRLLVPMLHIRYTMVYFPSLVLLAALFWNDVTWLKPDIRALIIGAVFASSLLNLYFINGFIKSYPREPWREMAAAMSGRRSGLAGTPVFSGAAEYFNYYLRRMNGPEAKPVAAFRFSDSAFYGLCTPYNVADSIPVFTLGYRPAWNRQFGDSWQIVFYRKQK